MRRRDLFDEPQALLHLPHPDPVTVVIVAALADRDLEVEPVVDEIGTGLADVVGDARRTEAGAGPAVGQGVLLAR